MAFGTLIFPIIFLVFVFNFIDLSMLAILLPSIYGLSFLSAFLYPKRFIKNVRLWSLFFGAFVFAFVLVVFTLLLGLDVWLYNATISLSVVYLINEFEGWSPLVKFTLSSAYKKATIIIDREKCTGCERCIEVCPKAVYDIQNRKSTVVRIDECISCKSCLVQCPAGAIDHSAKTLNEAL